MTAMDRFERILPVALSELADPRTPDYLADVLGRTADTRQRPAWASLERWLPMTTITATRQGRAVPWRQVGLLALLAILIAIGIAVYAGARPRPAPIFGPASNGNILYTVDGDVYAGDPVSGTLTALVTGPTYDMEPAYSRDGTRIAFVRFEGTSAEGDFAFMVMSADGTDIRAVTSEPLIDVTWWELTPDGTSLVVVHRVDGQRVFTLFDTEGLAPPRDLADGIVPEAPVFRPPDSAEILVRGATIEGIGLFVMDADGSDMRPLIAPARSDNGDFTLREPRYSPDGSQIAFHQWDDAASVMRLYVMQADGSNRRELGADPGIWFTGWPVWSNDGTRVAVQRGRMSTDSDGFDLPYAIIDVETGSVTETGPAPGCCRVEWAPDDSAILFLQEGDGVSRQMLLDPDGGPATALPWASDTYPTWQRKAD